MPCEPIGAAAALIDEILGPGKTIDPADNSVGEQTLKPGTLRR